MNNYSLDICSCCGGNRIFIRTSRDHLSLEVFNLSRCEKCLSIFVSDPPKDLEPYYQNISGNTMRSSPGSLIKFARNYLFKLELRSLNPYLRNDSRILDLGSGDGSLSRFLSKRFFTLSCDMYDPKHWKLSTPYLQLRSDGKLPTKSELMGTDIVIMRHVLEHVKDPKVIMSDLYSAGFKNLVVVVPNYDTFWQRFFKDDWYYWDPPRHLTHFTLQGIESLGKQTGWTIRNVQKHGIDEVIVSWYRRIYQTKPRNSSKYRPGGILSALSSVLMYFLGNGVFVVILESENGKLNLGA
jgi:hypothetical protein